MRPISKTWDLPGRGMHAALLALLGMLVLSGAPRLAGAETMPTNSYIIPMDTTYQDNGMFTAYGLVYDLLKSDVPVAWCMEPGKAYGGTDFTASGTDVQSLAVITNHAYNGGPFVIRQADAAAALPIITAWQALYPNTKVHLASAAFTATVGRDLTAAPTIAVLADGFEILAFGYLNVARVPDSAGNAWPTVAEVPPVYAAWPDVITPAELIGPNAANYQDGALHDTDATPAFCQIMSMHYNTASITDGEVGEVRDFLTWPTHAFMSCAATTES